MTLMTQTPDADDFLLSWRHPHSLRRWPLVFHSAIVDSWDIDIFLVLCESANLLHQIHIGPKIDIPSPSLLMSHLRGSALFKMGITSPRRLLKFKVPSNISFLSCLNALQGSAGLTWIAAATDKQLQCDITASVWCKVCAQQAWTACQALL